MSHLSPGLQFPLTPNLWGDTATGQRGNGSGQQMLPGLGFGGSSGHFCHSIAEYIRNCLNMAGIADIYLLFWRLIASVFRWSTHLVKFTIRVLHWHEGVMMPKLTQKFEHVLHIASRPYPTKDLASRMVLLKLLDWNGLFAWTCWFLIASGTYWWPFPTLHNCEVVYYSMTLWLYLLLCKAQLKASRGVQLAPWSSTLCSYILHTVPLVANWLRLHCLVHAAKALRTQLAPSRQPLRCAAEALVAWQSCFQLFCKCWLVMAGSFKTFQVQVFVCCINVYLISIYSILFFGFVIFCFPSWSMTSVFPVTAWFWHETLSWHWGMVSLLGSSRCPACWETAMGGAPLLSRSLAKGSRACVHHAERRISMPNYDCFWISWIIWISGCFWIRDSHL